MTSEKEPALNTGLTVGFISSVFVLINEFWPNLISDNLQSAITGIAIILIPTITAFLIRRKVWSPLSVALLKEEILALRKALAEESAKSEE